MINPLLAPEVLPDFRRIRPEHVEPALERVIAENERLVEAVAAAAERGPVDWHGVVSPLEAAGDRLARVWGPIRHLHAVADNPALREAFDRALAKLTAYASWFGQHRGLFRAYRALDETLGTADPARRAAVSHALRDFRLAGIDLEPEARERFRAIDQRLSELSNRFSQNLMDATDAWSLTVAPERLSGMPASAVARARAEGERRGEAGAVLTLDGPTYLAVMAHADDRDLRREVYVAWTTRASDEGPDAGRFDNTPLMQEILDLRHEQARLLGYDSWAERALATRMAGSVEDVLGFLRDLARRARPRAEEELEALRVHARDELGLETLEAWDLPWVAERLRQQRFAISDEDLRPYFPVDRVVEGLFAIVARLFGIEVAERADWPTWHPDVRAYEIRRGGERVGRFYLDLYARPAKRGGAWMDGFLGRRRTSGGVQVPVAFLTCNFAAPGPDAPALLTHDEVTTLFHEFGHGLHHMLTRVEVADVAGINGVPWDAVELPSQFLENWCWCPEGLALISGHWQSGEPLPEEMLRRLLAARNFQSAMMMLRQIEFGLFDMRLHHGHPPGDADALRRVLEDVREDVAVVRPPAWNRFENGFGHIFAGGYAAGYYSYKWAEVLSADAFSRFEQEGVLNPAVGADFARCILEQGGSRPPEELFRAFRGRDPDVAALLRHTGIEAVDTAEGVT